MIHYDLWLSNDVRLTALKAQENEARAAKMYATLRPLRAAIGRASDVLRHGWLRWQAAACRRAALRDLSRMNDHLLEDIGMTRGQMAELARQSIDGARPVPADKPVIVARRGRAMAEAQDACQVIPFARAAQLRDGRSEAEAKGRTRRAA